MKKQKAMEGPVPGTPEDAQTQSQPETAKSGGVGLRIEKFLLDLPSGQDEDFAKDLEALMGHLSALTDSAGSIRSPLPRATLSGVRALNAMAAKGDLGALMWAALILLDGVNALSQLARDNRALLRTAADEFSVWPITMEDTAKSCKKARSLMKSIGLGNAIPFPGLNIRGDLSVSFLDWLRRNHHKIGKLPDWPNPDPGDVKVVKSYVKKYAAEYPPTHGETVGDYEKDVEDSVLPVFRQIRSSRQPRPRGRKGSLGGRKAAQLP